MLLLLMTSSKTYTPILVVVHPGSACGSADFHIGKEEGAEARARLVEVLNGWRAGILVVDGGLSDELPGYPEFNDAVTQALDRASRSAQVSVRASAENEDLPLLIRRFIEDRQQLLPRMRFEVTGAWTHRGFDSGQVSIVATELQRLGFQADVSASAVEMHFDDDGEDLDLADEEVNYAEVFRRG